MKNELHYAKVKGWEKLSPSNCFLNYDKDNDKYFLANKLQSGSFVTKLTRDDWDKLGINETNADFEKVEE